jgi:hypothetical protein
MKRNYWYTGLSKWFMKNIIGPTGSGVRARDEKGHYKKDDKKTKDVNEAYEDGKTPADRNKRARGPKGKYKADDKATKRKNEAYKGGRKPKSKKPKKRGRPKGSKNKK